ncbi:unnamed protein product [Lactuca virosa]|uniref:RAB6-interacting golgin n=1 Tax=Lactuca virosa TaxID=75947 RepID=A0AAU9NM10_9ASTR|nr:unnamed protein product [Lactuca virosa]
MNQKIHKKLFEIANLLTLVIRHHPDLPSVLQLPLIPANHHLSSIHQTDPQPSTMATDRSFVTEIGPDGLVRESPVIAHTERMIEEEQLQLRKYIEENYSKIRDVERELTGLTMEMKLTAGPKKAALEHMRKKIEMSTEKIRLAKLKEEEAKKALEAASKAVKDEEALKQKLCEDLNNLVQESSSSQFARLEELKRRLEALNPRRSSAFLGAGASPVEPALNLRRTGVEVSVPSNSNSVEAAATTITESSNNNEKTSGDVQEGMTRGKKKNAIPGRPNNKGQGGGIGAIPKRGTSWTGAGFD